jgi:hypothetical protein
VVNAKLKQLPMGALSQFDLGLLLDLDFYIDAGDVRAIIGVDAGSFQQWLARELIDFKVVKSGKRTFRKFHISQVPRLVLISEIWKNGVLVGEAINTADTILSRLEVAPAHHPPIAADLLMYVLWFRQAGVVVFHYRGDTAASAAFKEQGYASCIFLHVETLRARIHGAVINAKRAWEGKGLGPVEESALKKKPAQNKKFGSLNK